MISIDIKQVTKKFGSVTALDDVTLRVEPGELFFLLGPSGCGKTTLLRSIAGFYVPEAGSIHFDQDDVTRLPPHKRNTGMMFQSYALWPHMTVEKNLAFGLEERKVPKAEIRERVAEALASVKMEDYGDRRTAQLSGGQQQRVALARALVVRPRCLLLDEPLSNLDAKLRLEMRLEIRRVCKSFGLTAIYVTHDQKEALSISDRMAILERGRIAQIGTPGEVYRRPRSKVVADFIGETNFIEGVVAGREQDCLVVKTELGMFHGYPGDADWRPATDEPVTLSVRPECWRLSHGEHLEGPNGIKGQVGEAVYLGEVAQYRFACQGQQLKIFELNPQEDIQASDVIREARVEPRDVVVLPR